MKSTVDNSDVDKLVPVPADLSKLSDIAKNDVVKKDVYNAKIKNTEDKILDITNLATTADLNAKINEVKAEMPNITNLATTTALSAAENKIPVSNLIKKTNYNTKISEIENQITDHDHSNNYITTPEFYKLKAENFAARLKQANLARKSDVANFVKKADLDNKLKDVTSNKNELNELSKKIKVISTKGLTKDLINKFSILNGAKYFSLGIFQNSLVFLPVKKIH